MRYQITADHSLNLSYAATVPAALKKYALAGSSIITGQGTFGYFLFQQLQGLSPETCLWYSNYLLEREEVFRYRCDEPQLRLQFALSNTFRFRSEDGQEHVLRQGSFNLYYDPYINSEMRMQPGRVYSMLSVYFPTSLLETWVSYFPTLAEFMEKVVRREPAVLCACNQVTTWEMDDIIQHIVRNPYPGFTQPLHTSIKITELLILVLDKVMYYPTTSTIRMRREEVQRFHEMKEVLTKDLEHPLSLKELARQFGLNVKKLKEGFKAIYDKTPFDFLLIVRMEKAKELLSGTDMSIEDIGESVGYCDKHSFSKAFKKYSGCPPASYRRNRNRAERLSQFG